jgi:hypothetical protein
MISSMDPGMLRYEYVIQPIWTPPNLESGFAAPKANAAGFANKRPNEARDPAAKNCRRLVWVVFFIVVQVLKINYMNPFSILYPFW